MKRKYFIFAWLGLLISCANGGMESNGSQGPNGNSSTLPSAPLTSDVGELPPSSLETSNPILSVGQDSSTHQPTPSIPSVETPSVEPELPSTEEPTYNPDGSQHLNPPTNLKKEPWSQTETIYDFSNEFPENFSYIYGHKILDNPNFYSESAGGGWKITVPNSSARMGVQTPMFETNLKLEIRLYIGGIFNNNNKVDEKTPFITIYGFSQTGDLVRTKEVDNMSNFYNYKNSKNPIQIYMNGEGISYLELRFTNAPYKSSQCYNFALLKMGFKTFPYAYEE